MSINEWVDKYRTQPSRLLIVDDLDGIAESIQAALKGYDCVFDVAYTGEIASSYLRLHKYDLVFLDIALPGKNGIEVLKEIKSLSPETPVVMMTGYFDGQLIEQATRLGIVSLMRKPIDFTPAFIKELFQLFKIRGIPTEEVGLLTTA
jgi:two-component system response regulator (stage 0 sporulation protein F)